MARLVMTTTQWFWRLGKAGWGLQSWLVAGLEATSGVGLHVQLVSSVKERELDNGGELLLRGFTIAFLFFLVFILFYFFVLFFPDYCRRN